MNPGHVLQLVGAALVGAALGALLMLMAARTELLRMDAQVRASKVEARRCSEELRHHLGRCTSSEGAR